MIPVTGIVELNRCDDTGIGSEYHKVERKPTHSINDSVWRGTVLEPHHLEELHLSEHNMLGQRLDKSSIENLFGLCEQRALALERPRNLKSTSPSTLRPAKYCENEHN